LPALIKKIAETANQATGKEFSLWESFVLFIQSILGAVTDKFAKFRVTNIELQEVDKELSAITKSNKFEQSEKSKSFKELVNRISHQSHKGYNNKSFSLTKT
jgi:hypothetical protein